MKRCFVCFLFCFLIALCLTACGGAEADDSVVAVSANSASFMPENVSAMLENVLLQTPESAALASSKKPSSEPDPLITFSYMEPYLEDENDDDVWTFWGKDMIWLDDDTLLCWTEYFHGFGSSGFLQEIIYTASSPDYVPQELMRINCENCPRQRKFIPLDGGAAFELDGLLYQYSANTGEIELLADLKALLGERYYFSPWSNDQNYDLSSDGERLLICTDEGLYEYLLSDSSAKLLVKSSYQTVEIEHIEGDCYCGETGFTFEGPIYAEYAPDGQSIACINGGEYGDYSEITLIDLEGNLLYTYETSSNFCKFLFFENEGISRFAIFECIYNSDLSGYKYENTLQIIEPFGDTVSEYKLPERGFESLACPRWLNDSSSGEAVLLYFDECMKTLCLSDGKISTVSPYLADFWDSFDDEVTYYFAVLSPDGRKVLFSQSRECCFIIPLF